MPRGTQGRVGRKGRPALEDGYWSSIRALFTEGVTGAGLVDFLRHEPGETLRFLTRDVNLDELRRKPWYRRYPLALWRTFVATAHRLSPPRRILFALATPLVFLGWLRFFFVEQGFVLMRRPSFFDLVLYAATFLLFLLVLELRDKLSLKGDLEVARQIQFGLLPFAPVDRPGLRLRVAMRPANTVGGDYFDVIDLESGRVALVVGDVAGKGMPAALLMALLQGSLQTLISAGHRGAGLVTQLNEHLCAHIPSNRLVTLFYSELDVASGHLRYVNAGHNPPLSIRSSGIERLGATGVALGILCPTAFDEVERSLEPGERLLLYTDGVVEAVNARDEEYGEQRLVERLQGSRAVSAQSMIEGIQSAVLAHAGHVRPSDDMTLMCVDRPKAEP